MNENVERKNLLTEEDIWNLPQNDRDNWDAFFSRLQDRGEVDKVGLERIMSILRNQYREGALRSPEINDRFPEIQAANLNVILGVLVQKRNNAILKDLYEPEEFKSMEESAKVITEYVENAINANGYHARIGLGVYHGGINMDAVAKKSRAIHDQLLEDIEYYPGYSNDKNTAYVAFIEAKRKFEALSPFHQFGSRIGASFGFNTKAAEEQITSARYHNQYAVSNINESPDENGLVHPYPYTTYAKNQKSSKESSKGASK